MTPTAFERNRPSIEVIRRSLEGSVNKSFWLDDVRTRVAFASLRSDTPADLVIVGGGFTGLWSAIRAKERNRAAEVVLLESDYIGFGASGRNGGFCEASITHGEANGRARWPEEFSLLDELGQRNLDDIERTIARYDIDCDFERSGNLGVATEPHQVDAFDARVRLNQDDIRAQVNSPLYLCGHFDPDAGAMLHPAKMCVELARVASSLGVRIFEHTKVTDIKKTPGGVEARSPNGCVKAQRAILATNAFPSLLKRYRRHTVPVYDYVLMTEPLSPARMATLGWKRRQGIFDVGNQFHYYRLSRDNRILFGGYDAVYHFGRRIDPQLEERPETFEKLAGNFFATFPQLLGLRFTHRWAGVIDTSTRYCAFFGRGLDGRAVHTAGFTGLGVGASRFAADTMLDLLWGDETERTTLRMVRELPMPFPPEPLAFAAIKLAQRGLARADREGGKRGLFLRAMDALGLGFDS